MDELLHTLRDSPNLEFIIESTLDACAYLIEHLSYPAGATVTIIDDSPMPEAIHDLGSTAHLSLQSASLGRPTLNDFMRSTNDFFRFDFRCKRGWEEYAERDRTRATLLLLLQLSQLEYLLISAIGFRQRDWLNSLGTL